ncbi:IS200/IS605 family transposase [Kiritimatiellota bacterium B12222]|nr:IS200/IS605 family transposase [Kiritimatiellota bacterium B12222]
MSYIHHCFHIIFSTKNREPMITDRYKNDLYAYIGGIIRDRKGALIEIGGVADHVHILTMSHQSLSPADLIRDIKSGSSRWINESKFCPGHFAWQTKYGSFSVSQSDIPDVARYIQNQVSHHQKESFQEEFRGFITRHGFSVDEKYMWE